jgi:putative ABC transport system permease protein
MTSRTPLLFHIRAHRLERRPDCSSVRTDRARGFGDDTGVVGVDPATIGRVYRFDWNDGSDAVLPRLGDGAIVDADYAKTHHLAVGRRLKLQTPVGEWRSFLVKATYNAPKVQPLVSGVVIAQRSFDAAFSQGNNALALVNVNGGSGAAATAGLEHALADSPMCGWRRGPRT